MPKFFFNVCDGVTLPDNVGSAHENVASVEREALRVMGALFEVTTYDPGQDWRVEVINETGQIIFVLRYTFLSSGIKHRSRNE